MMKPYNAVILLCLCSCFGNTVGSNVQAGLITKDECQALTYPSVFKHGYCFFVTGKVGDCVKRVDGLNKVQCGTIHNGAELMVLADDTLLPGIGDILKASDCASYPWIEFSLMQDPSPPGFYDNWYWILPDGSKLGPMAPSWVSSMWVATGDNPQLFQHRMMWQYDKHGYGDSGVSDQYLGYCMAQYPVHDTFMFSPVSTTGCRFRPDFADRRCTRPVLFGANAALTCSNKECTSQIIGSDMSVQNVRECNAKCHNTWHCMAFTYIDVNPAQCRLHWATQADSRHVSTTNANAQYWYVHMP